MKQTKTNQDTTTATAPACPERITSSPATESREKIFFDPMLDALTEAEGGLCLTEEAAALVSVLQERLEEESEYLQGAAKIAGNQAAKNFVKIYLSRSRATFALLSAIDRTLDDALGSLRSGTNAAHDLTIRERAAAAAQT